MRDRCRDKLDQKLSKKLELLNQKTSEKFDKGFKPMTMNLLNKSKASTSKQTNSQEDGRAESNDFGSDETPEQCPLPYQNADGTRSAN